MDLKSLAFSITLFTHSSNSDDDVDSTTQNFFEHFIKLFWTHFVIQFYQVCHLWSIHQSFPQTSKYLQTCKNLSSRLEGFLRLANISIPNCPWNGSDTCNARIDPSRMKSSRTKSFRLRSSTLFDSNLHRISKGHSRANCITTSPRSEYITACLWVNGSMPKCLLAFDGPHSPAAQFGKGLAGEPAANSEQTILNLQQDFICSETVAGSFEGLSRGSDRDVESHWSVMFPTNISRKYDPGNGAWTLKTTLHSSGSNSKNTNRCRVGSPLPGSVPRVNTPAVVHIVITFNKPGELKNQWLV